MSPLMNPVGSEKFRFIVAGASTTAFSYVLYLLLLLWMRPMPAYVVAYAAGIVWAYSVNSVWVFRGRWTWMGLLSYPLVYAVQAVLSVSIFALLIGKLHLPPVVAPLAAIVILLPINYVLGKRIVYHTSRPAMARSDKRP
ncbi:MAG: GtrA family protein [Xanthomonadales bacterium]|nr:GtrA family protein [Xanthomonadales bacterium]